MSTGYLKTDLVIVFKNTPRKNAKIRMKIFKNKHIDNLIDSLLSSRKKMLGIPKTAEFLQIGVGSKFEQIWKNKYNL